MLDEYQDELKRKDQKVSNKSLNYKKIPSNSNDNLDNTTSRINPEEIKSNLLKLFFNFGNFVVKENKFFISFQNTLKILRNTNILNSGLIKLPDIDILLKKINSKIPRFDNKQFLDFFVLLSEQIAKKLFDKSRKIAIEAVYRDFILPYILEINERSVSAEEINSGNFIYKAIEDFLVDYQICDFHCLIISDIYSTLFEIYKVYFHYEDNNYTDVSKIIERSLENLICFCKEFEIVPYSVSYNQLVVYYNLIIKNNLERIKEENINSSCSNKNNNSGKNNNLHINNNMIVKDYDVNLHGIDQKSNLNTNNNNDHDDRIIEKTSPDQSELNNYKEEQITSNFQNNITNNYRNNVNSIKHMLLNSNLLNSNNKDKLQFGKVFSFPIFLEMLIHISELAFLRLVYSSYSDMNAVERFLVFLEKLQSSKGFVNFERKTSKPHTLSSTLIPSKKTLIKIDPSIIDEFKFGNPEIHLLKEKGKAIKEIHQNSNELTSIKEVMSELNEENLNLLETKLGLLKDIFISYTGYSDKLSFMKINYTAFIKFLKDSKLVGSSKDANEIRDEYNKSTIKTISNSPKKNANYRQSLINFADTRKGKLTETDASLIFQQLTGPKNKHSDYNENEMLNKTNIDMKIKDSQIQNIMIDRKTQVKNKQCIGRLDFFLFIKSFEMISLKFYPNSKLNYAFKHFLLVDMKSILENRKNVSVLYSKQMVFAIKALKEERIVSIIQMLHDVLLPMYQNYCDNAGYMSFELLFDFYKDFDIFPEIVNLIQLKNIFFVLSESLVNDMKEEGKNNNSKCYSLSYL